ncbi:hypothetical protein AAAK29_25695 [Mesorhizobium sp. CCNWLW179-1]|uniref:hypothetical protein n=1 Tax=unclassified Mesorhizobium TaxID=325217 RepID=UPI00301470E4
MKAGAVAGDAIGANMQGSLTAGDSNVGERKTYFSAAGFASGDTITWSSVLVSRTSYDLGGADGYQLFEVIKGLEFGRHTLEIAKTPNDGKPIAIDCLVCS